MEQRSSGVTIDLGRLASSSTGMILLVIGIVLIMIGFMMISAGSFTNIFTGQPEFPGVYSLGLVAFGLGVALTVIGVIVKLTESPTVTPEPSETAAPSPVIKETIVKEVVLIPCEYCGALMPQTSTFCPNCGARRRT
jgi:hypothetical protein